MPSDHKIPINLFIQFKTEKEAEYQLVFLDVLITHKEYMFKTSIYYKQTSTGQYVNIFFVSSIQCQQWDHLLHTTLKQCDDSDKLSTKDDQHSKHPLR